MLFQLHLSCKNLTDATICPFLQVIIFPFIICVFSSWNVAIWIKSSHASNRLNSLFSLNKKWSNKLRRIGMKPLLIGGYLHADQKNSVC